MSLIFLLNQKQQSQTRLATPDDKSQSKLGKKRGKNHENVHFPILISKSLPLNNVEFVGTLLFSRNSATQN